MKLTKNKILILVPLLVLACGCLGQVTVDDIANSLGLTETESIPELPNYIYGYDNNGTLVSIDIISDTVWFKVSHRYPENTGPAVNASYVPDDNGLVWRDPQPGLNCTWIAVEFAVEKTDMEQITADYYRMAAREQKIRIRLIGADSNGV